MKSIIQHNYITFKKCLADLNLIGKIFLTPAFFGVMLMVMTIELIFGKRS